MRPRFATRAILIGIAAAIWVGGGAAAAAAHAWTWPVRGEVLAAYSNFAGRFAAGQHRGVDLSAAAGTPVLAAAGGHVRFAGTVGSSGLTVSIRTADGRFDTSYLHLATAAVRGGHTVAAGDTVGTVGRSGRRSVTAAHLHFGVRDAGTRRYRDPLDLLPPLPGVRDAPRGIPIAAPGPVRVGPAPQPSPRALRARFATAPGKVAVTAGAAAALRPASPPVPTGEAAPASRTGWTIACGALIAAAALAGGGGTASGRRRLRAAAARLRASPAGRGRARQ